jgi:drug/metabolite transporter superfamily protein YnfA
MATDRSTPSSNIHTRLLDPTLSSSAAYDSKEEKAVTTYATFGSPLQPSSAVSPTAQQHRSDPSIFDLTSWRIGVVVGLLFTAGIIMSVLAFTLPVAAAITQLLAFFGGMFLVNSLVWPILYLHIKNGQLGSKWKATGAWRYIASFSILAGITLLMLGSYFPTIIPFYAGINIALLAGLGITAAAFLLQAGYVLTRQPSLVYTKRSSQEKFAALFTVIISIAALCVAILFLANVLPANGVFSFLAQPSLPFLLNASWAHVFIAISLITLSFTTIAHFLRVLPTEATAVAKPEYQHEQFLNIIDAISIQRKEAEAAQRTLSEYTTNISAKYHLENHGFIRKCWIDAGNKTAALEASIKMAYEMLQVMGKLPGPRNSSILNEAKKVVENYQQQQNSYPSSVFQTDIDDLNERLKNIKIAHDGLRLKVQNGLSPAYAAWQINGMMEGLRKDLAEIDMRALANEPAVQTAQEWLRSYDTPKGSSIFFATPLVLPADRSSASHTVRSPLVAPAPSVGINTGRIGTALASATTVSTPLMAPPPSAGVAVGSGGTVQAHLTATTPAEGLARLLIAHSVVARASSIGTAALSSANGTLTTLGHKQ